MSTIITDSLLKDIGYSSNDNVDIKNIIKEENDLRTLVRKLQTNIKNQNNPDEKLKIEIIIAMLLMHSIPLAQEVLSYGADVNVANHAALRYALHSGNIGLTKVLLGAGADDIAVLKTATHFPWYSDVLLETKKNQYGHHDHF